MKAYIDEKTDELIIDFEGQKFDLKLKHGERIQDILHLKNGHFINCAKGDGSTNDTEAIQNHIDKKKN